MLRLIKARYSQPVWKVSPGRDNQDNEGVEGCSGSELKYDQASDTKESRTTLLPISDANVNIQRNQCISIVLNNIYSADSQRRRWMLCGNGCTIIVGISGPPFLCASPIRVSPAL